MGELRTRGDLGLLFILPLAWPPTIPSDWVNQADRRAHAQPQAHTSPPTASHLATMPLGTFLPALYECSKISYYPRIFSVIAPIPNTSVIIIDPISFICVNCVREPQSGVFVVQVLAGRRRHVTSATLWWGHTEADLEAARARGN